MVREIEVLGSIVLYKFTFLLHLGTGKSSNGYDIVSELIASNWIMYYSIDLSVVCIIQSVQIHNWYLLTVFNYRLHGPEPGMERWMNVFFVTFCLWSECTVTKTVFSWRCSQFHDWLYLIGSEIPVIGAQQTKYSLTYCNSPEAH
jgi:hypothetical protein